MASRDDARQPLRPGEDPQHIRSSVIPKPQLFTARVSVRGVQTTLEFLAESWSEATGILFGQYGDAGWTLTLKGAVDKA